MFPMAAWILDGGAVKALESPGGSGANPLRDYLVDERITPPMIRNAVDAIIEG